MKRISIIPVILLLCLTVKGQNADTLTLDFCYSQVEKNYPLARQINLIGKSSEIRIRNAGKNYLPQMSLNGSASLQSDVTKISVNLPTNFPAIHFPELNKDMYKVSLDVTQPVYDGHVTSYQEKLENYNKLVDQKNTEVELYKLKDQVNQLYLNILLVQENQRILAANREQLESKLKEIHSGISNGAVLASNADALEAEILKIDGELDGTRIDREAAISMLSELISTNISSSAILTLPDIKLTTTSPDDRRLELQSLSIQQERSTLMKNMVTTKWNPKLFAFGQAGYGRPGFNMLSNDFSPFWIVGAKVTWNFFNWNQNRNEKKIFDIQKDILNVQKEVFDKNIKIASEKNLSDVNKMAEMILKDEQIIDLRSRITRTASVQLDNGTITSSEYVSRMNEETQAKLTLEIHKIQLLKAKLNYLYNLGNL
ncbi:MAG: TolC family protein [Bacteroidota bacterium]|nr:TolC family protein [Bacteroidota bacterium]